MANKNVYVRCCRWLLVHEDVVEQNEDLLVGPNSSRANFEIFSQEAENYVEALGSDEVAERTRLSFKEVHNYTMGAILQENGEPYKGTTGF